MNITSEFLDKCKEKLGKSTAYQLAKYWDVSEQNLSRYYNGESVPDEFMCFKIAETLEVDPAFVIAKIRAESEKNEKKRDYFRSFGGTSRKAAASIIMALALSFTWLGGLTANGGSTVFLKRRHFV